MVAIGTALCGAVAPPGGGNVLPPEAKPNGYSLTQMAVFTGPYNTGAVSGNPATPPPPDVPFAVVAGDMTVRPGTMLYVPVFYADDAGGVPPGFPAPVGDQAADAVFLASFARSAYGITDLFIEVDGKITRLGGDYVAGVVTSPLLDGLPAGSLDIVSAAFLTPLPPGQHTIALGRIIDGKPVVFLTRHGTVTAR